MTALAPKPVYAGPGDYLGEAATRGQVIDLLAGMGYGRAKAEALCQTRLVEGPHRFEIVRPADEASMLARVRALQAGRE